MPEGGRGRGHGQYYKAKYGGGRGGRGGSRGRQGHVPGLSREAPPGEDLAEDAHAGMDATSSSGAQGSHDDLLRNLQGIDGRPYGAYKSLCGAWAFPGFQLLIHHVQTDPFAPPSRCSVRVPAAVANYPCEVTRPQICQTALCDFLTRRFKRLVREAGADVRQQSGGWSGAKGGEVSMDGPGQHVLERTSILFSDQVHRAGRSVTADSLLQVFDCDQQTAKTQALSTECQRRTRRIGGLQGDLEARFTMALPGRGRSIMGEWAATVLVQDLPRYVEQGLLYSSQHHAALQRHVLSVEDQESLRSQLSGLRLAAFVADGSILPRTSGASDGPMPSPPAVAFQSPSSLAMEVQLPNRGIVKGMGIPLGVTLIVGGGFHGKSTLLKALEMGVYNKVPGDGRELVATDASAVKIRAEDGRMVQAVDISPFIRNLPFGRDTTNFSTEDASGSTSQAANIQEALEAGSQLLLLDEDTCATNFMIRDARMQELVSADKEPIQPYINNICALAAKGVSSILVMGSRGDYFSVADHVICMDSFAASDVTVEAKSIAQQHGAPAALQGATDIAPIRRRAVRDLLPGSGGPRGMKVIARSLKLISLGDMDLDLQCTEQLAENSQTRAIGDALFLFQGMLGRSAGLSDLLDQLEAAMNLKGLDKISRRQCPGDLARPRRMELAAAVNRLRSAKLEQLP